MYGKCNISVFSLGFLALTMAFEIHPIVNNKNLTVLSSIATLGPRPLFTKIGNKYYFIETEVHKNWHDAYATCRQMGAHLIAFNTAEEWVAVTNYLVNNNLNTNCWTSGSDLVKEGNHIWFPTADPIDLDIWSPGEPNNQGGIEHCDHLWFQKEAVKLNDYSCEGSMPYICELAKQDS